MMTRQVLPKLLVLFVCATCLPALGQNSEDRADETAQKAGQEVEISEDNYRRFMELKDDRIKRSALPMAAYETPAGPQKIDDLPESSQKHLRNQLREIILKSGPWTPADADKTYPYVPSEAALTNRSLQNQEAAAWDELLEKFNEREAENYARGHAANSQSAQAQSAAGDTAAQPGRQGPAQLQPESRHTMQTGRRQGAQRNMRDSAPASNRESDEPGTAGTAQSALEYLQQKQMAGMSGAAPGKAQAGEAQIGEVQIGEVGDKQSSHQQAASSNAQAANSAGQPATAAATQQVQSAGQQASSSETQQGHSAGQQASSSREQQNGSSEKATKKETAEFKVRAKNTLSIKDLVHARGVSEPASNTPEPGTPAKPPDSEGDG